MHTYRSHERQARIHARMTLAAGAIIVALLAFAIEADAKCTIRAADPLIIQRYQGCSSKALISSLYNDLVTPYSFTCAKRISAECKKQGCENPQTREEVARCLGDYVAILESCRNQVDDAALMARCKDAKTWSVETIAARYPSSGGTLVAEAPATLPTTAIVTLPTAVSNPASPAPIYGPPSPDSRDQVTSGSLPGAAYRIVRKSARSTQSSRRIR